MTKHNLVEIIKLIFKKSLNSVGFVLTVGGVAVLNPDIIVTILKIFYENYNSEPENIDKITGWVLIILGVLMFPLDKYLNSDESPKKIKDKKSFNKLYKIIDRENLNEMLNQISANHCIFPSHQEVLDDLYAEISNFDSKYWDKKIETKRNMVESALYKAINNFGINYHDIGGGRMMLQPDLRRTLEYDEYVEKEIEYIEELRKSYNSFRNIIRKRLKI